MSDLKIQMAAGTNVGLVRQNNEDNFVVCPDLAASDWRIPQVSKYEDLGEYGALLVVADGMGGANAGEVASAIAVETIQEAFSQEQLRGVVKDDKAVQEFMKEVVKAADLRIFKKSKDDSSTRGMGTTVVMAWILGERAYVCWCGDSRCYMLNKQKGLIRLSKDHSYVQELIDRGELDPELAMSHPYSNVITRCLGDVENRAVPDTRVFQLHNGDTILLCSDGLSGLCTDVQVLDLLIKFRDDIEKCKDELISAALNEGGHDNVTVALCNIEIPDDKEDVEDDTLPKGTLPPEPQKNDLSETLRSGKPSRKQVLKKRNPWKGLIFFIFMVAIAFFSVKWLRTSPGNQRDIMATDTINIPINVPEEDSYIIEDIAGKEDNAKATSGPEDIKTQPTQVTEDKQKIDMQDAEEITPTESISDDVSQLDTDADENTDTEAETKTEVTELSDTTNQTQNSQ